VLEIYPPPDTDNPDTHTLHPFQQGIPQVLSNRQNPELETKGMIQNKSQNNMQNDQDVQNAQNNV
jgi:hypothetical protein